MTVTQCQMRHVSMTHVHNDSNKMSDETGEHDTYHNDSNTMSDETGEHDI